MAKNLPAHAGDARDRGSGRSPRGHGNPLQYSYLENYMNRGAWQQSGYRRLATVPWVAKSQT